MNRLTARRFLVVLFLAVILTGATRRGLKQAGDCVPDGWHCNEACDEIVGDQVCSMRNCSQSGGSCIEESITLLKPLPKEGTCPQDVICDIFYDRWCELTY
jgi:hypothetical protein